MKTKNIYKNMVMGATSNPVMLKPDAIDELFAKQANEVLSIAVEVVRELIGTHQSAIAIIVQKDWTTVRKFFSLSSKYKKWENYHVPAGGYGIHAWLLEQKAPIRLTQTELEQHPAWKNFGTENGKHPPMNGWLAAPLIDSEGINWGLVQLSDKYHGDFTEEDERKFIQFVHLLSLHLEALWTIRNLNKSKEN